LNISNIEQLELVNSLNSLNHLKTILKICIVRTWRQEYYVPKSIGKIALADEITCLTDMTEHHIFTILAFS
jgi:hypothetical protein